MVTDIAWTDGLNGDPRPGRQAMRGNNVNPSKSQVHGVLTDAARARQAGAEVIIACMQLLDPAADDWGLYRRHADLVA